MILSIPPWPEFPDRIIFLDRIPEKSTQTSLRFAGEKLGEEPSEAGG
jgi:hypothetical protein